MEFAIVDIETTGGNPMQGGITEVAVLIHDGQKVTDSYHSLINPERFIPGFITGLTGIDQQMVQDAPTFGEVAKDLFDKLQGKVFVAHNVNFDYSFIREALRKEGIMFDAPKLCTVRLSRLTFPGFKSYGLGRICEHLDIRIENRHRAMGDAEATAKLFGKILQKNAAGVIQTLKKNNGGTFLPPNISKEKYSLLPESTGIYYFHNAKGQVIYVGKALNIKSRFKGHFSGNSKDKAKLDLKSEIHDITWQLTGNEFLAFLLELQEIKRIWPKYNQAQKYKTSSWGLFQYEDCQGFIRFQVAKIRRGIEPVYHFDNHAEGWKFLMDKVGAHNLCPKLCGIQKTPHACYDFDTGNCNGACCGNETASTYNERATELIDSIQRQSGSILIKQNGRTPEEESALYFEKGIFAGYSFISKETEIDSVNGVMDSLQKVKLHTESKYILRSFIGRIPLNHVQVIANHQ